MIDIIKYILVSQLLGFIAYAYAYNYIVNKKIEVFQKMKDKWEQDLEFAKKLNLQTVVEDLKETIKAADQIIKSYKNC